MMMPGASTLFDLKQGEGLYLFIASVNIRFFCLSVQSDPVECTNAAGSCRDRTPLMSTYETKVIWVGYFYFHTSMAKKITGH